MRWTYVLFALLFVSRLSAQEVRIPDHMMLCGIEVAFTAEARAKLAEHVRYIQQSPRYFNQMLQRGYQYMPFIEEALADAGVPDDLKYLAIQESGLRPAVVSSSNAVGFWQFKADAARENGLQVSDKVDERMHIYRASVAAGRYLTKSFYDFDNWLYAIIAYYEGPTGAVKHTDPAYYGAQTMTITGDFHWYALKWIAHKIAYEDGLAQKRRPEVFLMPYSTKGESQVRHLIAQHQVEEVAFFEANPWIIDQKRLPKDETFTYYIARPGTLYTGHIPDPNKVISGTLPVPLAQGESGAEDDLVIVDELASTTPPAEPQPAPEQPPVAESQPTRPRQAPTVDQPNPQYPPALAANTLAASQQAVFRFTDDLHYGTSYILYDGSQTVAALSDRYAIRFRDLLMWNGLAPGIEPPAGTILYLTKPKKAAYHVVEAGETITAIAARHRTSVRKIQRRNGMDRDNYRVYVGQKLYLQDKKPKQEKLIILERPDVPAPNPTAQDQPQRPRNLPADPGPATGAQPTPRPIPQPEPASGVTPQSRWIVHTVQPGETLWQISQRYETKVAIIKQVNNLTSDLIHAGQQLKVRARETTLSQAE